MKVQKTINVLATLSILCFGVACNDRYQEGFDAGKAEGYQEGYAAGDADGYARAQAYFQTADYTKGFNDGRSSGIAEGYTQGYNVGKGDGYTQGYNVGKGDGYSQGYNVGKNDGYNLGYDDGYDDGAADGYDLGYTDGTADGYDLGYDDGYGDGYDVGYDDGYFDGGLSVGATPKLKGYADVLSAFHNDLIDYSKIPAPKMTKRGLVANGKLLLSEVSMTNKDTLKRKAVEEQYLVIEMSKQVKSKFGLSAERSLQIAKAANHFRKFSKRGLTAEDTNAYASEIVGVNFKTIEKAFQNSMKGELSDLDNIMNKAADKNGVRPEKMQEIVSKMFL